jgi:spermidine synthase
MSDDNANNSANQRAANSHLLLLLLFVGSGCAALIYEIVWFQLLELVIGSSAVSLGVLLGTYMGGMCLGSLLLARVVSRQRHPLRVYAVLEVGIGICGVMVLFLVPHVARVYAAHVGHGLPGILLRGLVCAVCLLPPTLLMGATLPAISRRAEASPRAVSWLGFFYGGNIAGAVFGCLLAGFYLLRVHDMAVATYIAVAINGAVALAAFCAAVGEPVASISEPRKPETPAGAQNNLPVYLAIALSGLCALGAEVIWTRLLSLLLGPTVYAFSVILAVFLVGLGIGSGAGSFLAREIRQPRLALGGCQLFVVIAMGWAAYALGNSLPYWPVNPSLSRDPWLNFQLDLARCFWAILPSAIFWGASFPLALASVAAPGLDPGKMVGKIYAANTAGAIVGAVGTSVLLIGWLGTRHAQQVLIVLSAISALAMFVSWRGTTELSADQNAFPKFKIAGALLLVVAVAVAIASNIPGVPWQLVAFGRYLPTYNDGRSILYLGEGLNASVAVTELVDGVRNFHVSGKVEASSDRNDMRLQRMLGHIPALIHPHPRSVLVVGCGAGVTAGSFTTYPGIERIVICEIEPLIPHYVAKFFTQENYNVTGNPRVEIVYDDARHYILTTKEKFDIITSDPIHPWVKGAATLYTKEYFELVKQHLNPGGLVTQWVPLYESNSGVVKSEVATFFQVFTNGTIWGNESHGAGYDTIVLGSADPMTIDVDDAQARMERAVPAAQSLHDVGFFSAISLLATYAGRNSDLTPWLANAEINRDRNLRLQYLAGMASNLYQEGGIYEEILSYRKFPDGLFAGSDDSRQALKKEIEKPDHEDTSR